MIVPERIASMKTKNYGSNPVHKNAQTHRWLALLLCLTLVISTFSSALIAESAGTSNSAGPTLNASCVAAPDTSDSYIDKLLSDMWGSRYAGRLWSDKSVFLEGENLSLDMLTDGFDSKVSSAANFLHAFSTLGSSTSTTLVETPPIDLALGIDITSSMLTGGNSGSNIEYNGKTDYKAY